eukprot:3932103-Rhodomonas_salina.2
MPVLSPCSLCLSESIEHCTIAAAHSRLRVRNACKNISATSFGIRTELSARQHERENTDVTAPETRCSGPKGYGGKLDIRHRRLNFEFIGRGMTVRPVMPPRMRRRTVACYVQVVY